MTQSIEAAGGNPVRKYVATFTRADLAADPEIRIANPVKDEHVVVVVRDADGLQIHIDNIATAAQVTLRNAADPDGLGPEPYSVTIFG